MVTSMLYGGYLTWRMRGVMRYSLRSWILAIVLGVPFLPLAWLPSVLGASSWLLNAGLYGAFVVGYGGALIILRVVTRGEITAMWRIVGSKGLRG
jgi:hypothetical protein